MSRHLCARRSYFYQNRTPLSLISQLIQISAIKLIMNMLAWLVQPNSLSGKSGGSLIHMSRYLGVCLHVCVWFISRHNWLCCVSVIIIYLALRYDFCLWRSTHWNRLPKRRKRGVTNPRIYEFYFQSVSKTSLCCIFKKSQSREGPTVIVFKPKSCHKSYCTGQICDGFENKQLRVISYTLAIGNTYISSRDRLRLPYL